MLLLLLFFFFFLFLFLFFFFVLFLFLFFFFFFFFLFFLPSSHSSRFRSPLSFRQKFSVVFDGESGIDASGLTKEMFHVFFQSLFSSGQSEGARASLAYFLCFS